MNIRIVLLLASFSVLTACSQHQQNQAKGTRSCQPVTKKCTVQGSGPYSQFIPIDSANKMINSYLNSINYTANDTDLRCIIINADTLFNMLKGMRGKGCNIKLMLAHTLNYINSGGQNQYAGYQSGALTLIIAAYDADGNYVYMPYNNMVLDEGMPCPTNCPKSGTAMADTFAASARSLK